MNDYDYDNCYSNDNNINNTNSRSGPNNFWKKAHKKAINHIF